MKSTSYLPLAGRFLIGLFLFAGFAPADTLLNAPSVDWTRGESIWLNEDGAPQNAYFAGVVLIDLTQSGQTYDRDTMCVDLFTDIFVGVTYNTNVVSPTDVPNRNLSQVAWLLDNVLMPTQGPVYSSEVPSSDWATSVKQGAGLQLAIWDLTTDGGDGFSSGRVQASTTPGEETPSGPNSVLSWAETYETLSAGQTSDQAFVYINSALGSGTPAQMLEGPVFTDGGPAPPTFTLEDPSAAPEPATCALAGLALIGIGILGRRARSRAKRSGPTANPEASVSHPSSLPVEEAGGVHWQAR